ncbi:MAG TPA: hypothetical protein VFQ26_08855, partial [Nitrospiraceae bacterium]|nr:hypothetical protein [Nitrospiraceae bacterium]
TAGDRATASLKVRAAFDQLTRLLRDGYNFIQGLGSFAISDAERLGLFTTYGWESGKVGDFTDARLELLATQALAASSAIANPAHRYPTALLDLITTQLNILNANQPLATGGSAQVAIDARDTALELLHLANSRVRHFYCEVSDDVDQTPELARIARQPRRKHGAAQPQPLPDAPGTVTFDEASRTLTAPEMPAHATSTRAYRRPAGSIAEFAGTSSTTTVSIVDIGPMTSGVTYDLWLIGHNSQGDGPDSNHITHVAT